MRARETCPHSRRDPGDVKPALERRCENRPVHDVLESTANQLRVAKRLAPRRGASFAERFGRLDDRLVFVVGSPRSGTTFLAGAIGSLSGFVDLGEVAPVKAAVPELAAARARAGSRSPAANPRRRASRRTRRVGRPVEQTPEMAFVVRAVPLAYPDARIVHIVRDGRDVVCSLLEKPWLRREQAACRRRRRAVRRVCALLGGARTPSRVRGGERRASRGLGLAELRRGGAGSGRGARDPVRGSRRRSGGRCRGARRPPRRPRRAAGRCPRTRTRVLGRPLPHGSHRRAARQRSRRRPGRSSASSATL